MAWRLVESLKTIREQVDAAWPGRSAASDGTIGDPAHQGTSSDHNPRTVAVLGSTPVVLARDITHDPASGADMAAVAEALRASRDSRIAYVIFNRRVFSSVAFPAWQWRPYAGTNPHTSHLHLSVVAATRADDPRPWSIGATMTDPNLVQESDPAWGDLIFGMWSLVDNADHPGPSGRTNKLAATLARIEAKLDAIAPGPITDEQLDAALRRVLGSLDGATPGGG